jgi:hypothetical protein
MAEHNASYTGWFEGVPPIGAAVGGKRDRTVLSQWEFSFLRMTLYYGLQQMEMCQ